MVDFAKHLKKRTPRIDLNPSSAERWTTCTASPKFIFDNWDKLPPHDTFYNQEGTTAHEVASALLQGFHPKVFDDRFDLRTGAGEAGSTLDAVSYTHLDVYKRQGH